jgi:hypothetical protein
MKSAKSCWRTLPRRTTLPTTIEISVSAGPAVVRQPRRLHDQLSVSWRMTTAKAQNAGQRLRVATTLAAAEYCHREILRIDPR